MEMKGIRKGIVGAGLLVSIISGGLGCQEENNETMEGMVVNESRDECIHHAGVSTYKLNNYGLTIELEDGLVIERTYHQRTPLTLDYLNEEINIGDTVVIKVDPRLSHIGRGWAGSELLWYNGRTPRKVEPRGEGD